MGLQSTTSTAEYLGAEADFIIQPIPLDLPTLANFTDPPTQGGIGLLRGFGGGKGDAAQVNTPGVNPEPVTDSRAVYPCTILHTGRLGGLYTVYAESTQARSDWKEKRLGCARSCRSRTRCSKSRRSARTPLLSRLCSRHRGISRGIQRLLLLGRSPAPCR
jgi:hypothetical protein